MFDKLENNDVVLLVGRVMLGLIYAMAVMALISGKVPVDFAAAGAKIVAFPAIVVWIGYTVKVLSGLCLIVGFQTRLAALALIVFTLITAFNYHTFGDSTFMKEMSMIGGLLILAAAGAGKLSVDGKSSK